MKKRLSFFLAIVLVLCALLPLASCGGTVPADTTDTSETQAEVTTSIPEPSGDFVLVDSGDAKGLVIKRSDASGSSDADVTAALSIQKAISKLAAENPSAIKTDWTKNGEQNHDTVEILVGFVNYDESRSVTSLLAYGGYAVKAVGNKIVVTSYTQSGIKKAADLLINMIEKAKVTGDDGKTSVTLKAEDLNVFGNSEPDYAAIPIYPGNGSRNCYSSGPICYEMIFSETNPDEFSAYCAQIEKAGFTKYTSHEMNGNPFVTYYNNKQILNVGYYACENKTRVITQPYDEKQLPARAEDNKYEVVTTGKLVMLGVSHYDSSNTLKGNGLAVVIRLTDGRFVIVDGGFNWTNHTNQMVSTLKNLSKDYSSKTGIKVAAWIITHAHGDHNGLFNTKYMTLKNNGIVIERFLESNLSVEELNRSYASSYGGNFSETQGELKTNNYVSNAVNPLGSYIEYVHTGQVFNYANVKMEVLYNIESLAPAVCNALNTTSLIIKMTFRDEATGKETVYMSTGDGTGPAFLLCSKMYGDYLKSDIVQVAHHGGSSWGTENGTIAAYKLMKPETVLFPSGISTYEKYSKEARNSVLLKTATNPNFKEVFASGWDGSSITLDIPYTVGTAILDMKGDPTK